MNESSTLRGGSRRAADPSRAENADSATGTSADHRSDAAETGREVDVNARGVDAETGVANEELLELLGDEYARAILEELSARPTGAGDLVDRVEMSRATVYRRLDRLEEHGLVVADVAIDPDGNHHKVFEPTLECVTVDLDDGNPVVDVELRDDDQGADDAWSRVPASVD